VIANDGPKRLADLLEEQRLRYPLLVDPDATTIRAFGVLNEAAGEIPHPTTVILDTSGVARFVRVDEDYTVRPAPEELFEVLEALQREETDGPPRSE
jgi:peroxiredoxin